MVLRMELASEVKQKSEILVCYITDDSMFAN